MRRNKSSGFSELSEKMHIAQYGVLGRGCMWQDMGVQLPAGETQNFLAMGICKCTFPTLTSCWFLLESVIIIGSFRHLLASMDVAKATGGLIDMWLPQRAAWVAAADLLRSICIAPHLPPGFCCDLWIQINPRLVFVNNKYPKIRIQVDKFWKG